MVNDPASLLHALYGTQRFAELRQVTAHLLAGDPTHLQARFYQVMCHLHPPDGDVLLTQSGLFSLLLEEVNRFHQATDPAMFSRVGFGALVLARLTESHMTAHDSTQLSLMRGAAQILHITAQICHHPVLLREARLLEERLIPIGHDPGLPERTHLRVNSPWVLQLEPTNHCNLRCIMCPRNTMTRPVGFLSRNILEAVFSTWSGMHQDFALPDPWSPDDLLMNLHIRRTVKLYFMGEPLAHPGLNDVLSVAARHGANLTLQTNGLLLNKAKVRQTLLSHGSLHLSLSVDGSDPASYEALRQGGKWEKLLQGVERFRRERAAVGKEQEVRLYLSTIVSRVGGEEEERSRRFLEPLSALVDRLEIILLDRDTDPRFVDAQGAVTTMTRSLRPPCPANTPLCYEPLYKLNILWDGTITACCSDVNGQLVLGHVLDPGGIDGVWRGERVRALQNAILTHDLTGFPLCQRCQEGAV